MTKRGVSRRWSTRFGRWARGYGAARLARDVGLRAYGQPLTPDAVYGWVAGRIAPRPVAALTIVALAHGEVGLDDIYAQRASAQPKPAAKDRAGSTIAGARGSEHGGKSS